MALKRPRSRRRSSITSLIDVIFLLLLFFMLASTFSDRTEIELVAGAESLAGDEPPLIVRLLVLADGLELNGRPVSEAALASSLGVELSRPNSVIAVELGDEVTTQRLVDIFLRLRAVPGARVHVMVQP